MLGNVVKEIEEKTFFDILQTFDLLPGPTATNSLRKENILDKLSSELHRCLTSSSLLQHSFIVQLEIQAARQKSFALFFYLFGKFCLKSFLLTKGISDQLHEYKIYTKIQKNMLNDRWMDVF